MRKKHLEILHLELFFLNVMSVKSFLILFFYLLCLSLSAQKNVTNQELVWYGYYNTLNINENWSLKSEIQERHFDNTVKQHQLVFRSNLENKLVNNLKFSMGMTLFLQSPNNKFSNSDLIVPELRPDIGLNTKQEFKRMSILHRYKLEARFFHQVENDELIGGYSFSNFRFRYQLGVHIPVLKTENQYKIVLVLKDELMVNFGSKIIKNTFDQNRIYVALNYVINPKIAIEMGYMNWFQQQTSGIDFYNRNIFRLSLFHSLSLNNKKHE